MTYEIQLIRKKDQTASRWAGGQTTQLAIYPENANYAERDFSWRISSAVVELETSVFTPLPKFNRLIMVLEGEMTLEHEGHHKIHLQPFEQDRFKGEWTTRSRGKVRDFNLMLSEGIDGSLEPFFVDPAGELEVDTTASLETARTDTFYCVHGSVSFEIGRETIEVHAGDFLLLKLTQETPLIRISNKCADRAKFIRATVWV